MSMGSIGEKIALRLRAFNELPVRGKHFLETHRLIAEPDIDAAGIARIIEKDPWLSAKILAAVNSVYYSGRYGEISGLKQAVARLGLDEVKRISLAFSVMNIFPDESGVINSRDFWLHSIGAAMMTRSIAECAIAVKVDADAAYVAGLFHDAGMLFLAQCCPEAYRAVREAAAGYSESLLVAEKKLMDIDHAEAGGMVLEQWKLPEVVVSAVRNHHEPDCAAVPVRPLAQVVHLADFSCSLLGAGEPGDTLPQGFSHGAFHDLGVDPESIQQIIARTEEEIERTKILFHVV